MGALPVRASNKFDKSGECWNGLQSRLKICAPKGVVGSNPTSPTIQLIRPGGFAHDKPLTSDLNVLFLLADFPLVNVIELVQLAVICFTLVVKYWPTAYI